MGKFDMKSFAATLGMVPESGIKQIEYIDIDMLHEDPRNFYEVSGVDELASNIALFGLMDPLLVRNAEDGTVQIVSGHRRHAALRKLVEEGHEDLRQVPCIRVEGENSPALQELRLIYANSDTRKMTNADIGKQAERVEQLLYQLKEEGHEFPGRMRDHVAEACKISKSKLSRLHAIQNNLDPVWSKVWECGKLSEATAYALSKLPVKHQRIIAGVHFGSKSLTEYFYANTVERHEEWLSSLEKVHCPMSGKSCTEAQISSKFIRLAGKGYEYNGCERTCCAKCSELGTCKTACPLLHESIAAIKANIKEQKRQEKLAQEAKDAPIIAELQALWARFGECREGAGKTVQQFCEAIKYYYGKDDDENFRRHERLDMKFTPNTPTPFQYKVYLDSIRALKAAADLFGVSLDYLLCRTDDPSGAAAPSDAAPKWREGQLPTSGLYFVKLRLDDNFVIKEVLWYDNVLEEFSFHGNRAKVEGEVLGWCPLPCGLRNGEVEEDAEDR